MSNKLPEIVLSIPVNWNDDFNFVQAVVQKSGGYLFAGRVLMHIESKWIGTLEICDRDPTLSQTCKVASGGTLSDAELTAIDAHTAILYLTAEGGSFDNARAVMRAAKALLQCGGIAIQVESSGVAHSAQQWINLTDAETLSAFYKALVPYVGGDGLFYSCGMHHLGYRDAYVTADIAPTEAAQLLHAFLCYLSQEDPTMHDGEIFSISKEAPQYRINKAECDVFAPDHLFHNPYGIWNLVPV